MAIFSFPMFFGLFSFFFWVMIPFIFLVGLFSLVGHWHTGLVEWSMDYYDAAVTRMVKIGQWLIDLLDLHSYFNRELLNHSFLSNTQHPLTKIIGSTTCFFLISLLFPSLSIWVSGVPSMWGFKYHFSFHFWLAIAGCFKMFSNEFQGCFLELEFSLC